MTIVAVNGGGNTPQGVQLERCFVKSWSTSGDADGTNDSFNFTDYKPTEVHPSNIGGVSVGCGDVHDALGDPVTFTYTVRVDSSAYEGSHALYQDVFVPPPPLETGPALAIEAVTIVHEGYWL
jgi:hypothetical protein